jgi:hypothetical protein
MPAKLVFVKNLSMNEVIPMLVGWFSDQGFDINTVANRIDATMDSVTLKILVEDYGKGCTVSITGPPESTKKVVSYVSEISEFESTTTQCEYCETLFSTELSNCPHCGAKRKANRAIKS